MAGDLASIRKDMAYIPSGAFIMVSDRDYPDAFMLDGKLMANIWQGEFSIQNLMADGIVRMSPVRAYPPNGHGFYDIVGNVCEWTSDFYAARRKLNPTRPCCVPRNPRGAHESESFDAHQPNAHIPRKALKSGSYLCAPNCCQRYRPAAPHGLQFDSSTNHVGFRCVVQGQPPCGCYCLLAASR